MVKRTSTTNAGAIVYVEAECDLKGFEVRMHWVEENVAKQDPAAFKNVTIIRDTYLRTVVEVPNDGTKSYAQIMQEALDKARHYFVTFNFQAYFQRHITRACNARKLIYTENNKSKGE